MSEVVNEVCDFLQIEHYHSRLKKYMQEAGELLNQVLPKEEAQLVSLLIGYILISTLWDSEGYGPGVTPQWIKRETISLKRQINQVRRKHSL